MIFLTHVIIRLCRRHEDTGGPLATIALIRIIINNIALAFRNVDYADQSPCTRQA